MKLSVVLATTHPWPAAEECLRILAPQAIRTGAEILLADSTGQGFPKDPPAWLQPVRHLVLPGASVFALRAHATNHARAAIVAWTEDHCRPASDWCQRILDAHANSPERLVIGGAVCNASTGSSLDWANFLSTFATFVPPLHPARNFRVPPGANVSFKRAALPDHPLEPGEIEFRILPGLCRQKMACLDSAIVVGHMQSHGWPGTPVSHFHNGRSTCGMNAGGLTIWRRLARIGSCLLLPPVYMTVYLIALTGKKNIPYLRVLPLVALLTGAHAAGELTGLLTASAGRSPIALE